MKSEGVLVLTVVGFDLGPSPQFFGMISGTPAAFHYHCMGAEYFEKGVQLK